MVEKGEKFSGAIEEIVLGSMWDANDYMVIGGRQVIFGSGWSKSKWGKLIGFPDLQEKEKEMLKKNAEVYAGKLKDSSKIVASYADEAQEDPKRPLYKVKAVYTLAGNEKYYIKLI